MFRDFFARLRKTTLPKRPSIPEPVRDARLLYSAIRMEAPDAYSGFVTDAAVRAAAVRHGWRSTDLIREYRRFFPASSNGFPPPRGALKPPTEAITRAIVETFTS